MNERIKLLAEQCTVSCIDYKITDHTKKFVGVEE